MTVLVLGVVWYLVTSTILTVHWMIRLRPQWKRTEKVSFWGDLGWATVSGLMWPVWLVTDLYKAVKG